MDKIISRSIYLALLATAFMVVGSSHLKGQSPHGDNLKTNCAACHSSASWVIEQDTFSFNHDTTAFALTGVHTAVDCKSCHETLVFEEANTACISCHTDLHQMTVGSRLCKVSYG